MPNGGIRPPVSRPLDTVGDGTGATNANGDFSAFPAPFLIAAPPFIIYEIKVFRWNLRAIGDQPRMAGYGAGVAPLTNGILIRKRDPSTVLLDFTGGVPIVTNTDWTRLGTIEEVELDFGPPPLKMLSLVWDIAENLGQPIRLRGDRGESLEVLLADDFTTLVSQQFFTVQGREEGRIA